MRAQGKPPENDREYYTSAAFYYFVDWVIHTLLKALQIPDQTLPGRVVHQALNWMVGIGYVIYVVRLLLPDASEQVAEMRVQITRHWHRTTRRKKP